MPTLAVSGKGWVTVITFVVRAIPDEDIGSGFVGSDTISVFGSRSRCGIAGSEPPVLPFGLGREG